MTEDVILQMASIWQKEFISNTKEQVIEAFKLARSESPDFIPAIPKVQAAIKRIALENDLKKRLKTPEDLFRESHCGKSPEEWKRMNEWEASPEGAQKVKQYKQRLLELIGDQL
jgi:hypothetical protein